jgi:hypothetical protein
MAAHAIRLWISPVLSDPKKAVFGCFTRPAPTPIEMLPAAAGPITGLVSAADTLRRGDGRSDAHRHKTTLPSGGMPVAEAMRHKRGCTMFNDGFWSDTAGDAVEVILAAILALFLTPLSAFTNGLYNFLNGLLIQ